LTGSTDIQIVGDDLTVTNPKRIQVKISFSKIRKSSVR
jgi:enolase